MVQTSRLPAVDSDVPTTIGAVPVPSTLFHKMAKRPRQVKHQPAAALDIQLDDGNPAQGSFRATVGPNNIPPAAAPAAYSEDQTYTVCRDLG